MKLNFYRSTKNNNVKRGGARITTLSPSGHADAGKYIPHPDLADAVNVALALGRPLLLTGEPGTGKTELAYAVADQLSLAGPFKYVAKSTSQHRDLFYTYDALGRFYAAQSAEHDTEQRERAKNLLNFITFTGLGKAILLAHKKETIKKLGLLPPVSDELLNQEHQALENRDGEPFVHPGEAQRSVVLIDEIDKAPRDFTNDLLDEIDRMQFRVPELQNILTPELKGEVRAKYWPLIIITSNEEKNLPDPFLRRCLYHHIEFPERRSENIQDGHDYYIEDIVTACLGRDFMLDGGSLEKAIDVFYALRDKKALGRKPATAELLDWLIALKASGADGKTNLDEAERAALLWRTRSALIKNIDERDRIKQALSELLGLDEEKEPKT